MAALSHVCNHVRVRPSHRGRGTKRPGRPGWFPLARGALFSLISTTGEHGLTWGGLGLRSMYALRAPLAWSLRLA